MEEDLQQRKTNTLKYWQYEEGRDKPKDVRNVLLVVAALIAGLTFQAGVSPPDNFKDNKRGYYLFSVFNTLAFSGAASVILILTLRFPLYYEVYLSIVSMNATFGMVIVSNAPHGSTATVSVLVTVASLVPYVGRWLVQKFKHRS